VIRMPFSKHDIDPEHIEMMHTTFCRVCDVLKISSGREDLMTELIAMKVVDLVKAGESTPAAFIVA
jgi:hypothetical protein